MKYNIEISKILDKHLPANGVGTKRELLRMNIHRDMTDLINKLNITDVVGQSEQLVCDHFWKPYTFDSCLVVTELKCMDCRKIKAN